MDSKELKAAIARGAESLKKPAKEGQTHSRQTADAHDKRREEVAKLVNSSYEVVADYLFNEGYADSFESALIVADVISDEWFGDILEAKKPLPIEKMLKQAGRHREYAGWVTGELEGNRFNQHKKRKPAQEIIQRANDRADKINKVLLSKVQEK
jgi:hypothetical protein